MNLAVCFWHFDLSSGNWTRTSDLRVMSPTSYLLLYPAIWVFNISFLAFNFRLIMPTEILDCKDTKDFEPRKPENINFCEVPIKVFFALLSLAIFKLWTNVSEK